MLTLLFNLFLFSLSLSSLPFPLSAPPSLSHSLHLSPASAPPSLFFPLLSFSFRVECCSCCWCVIYECSEDLKHFNRSCPFPHLLPPVFLITTDCLLFMCLSVGHLLAKEHTVLELGVALMVMVHIETFCEHRLRGLPLFACLSHFLFVQFILPVGKMNKDQTGSLFWELDHQY